MLFKTANKHLTGSVVGHCNGDPAGQLSKGEAIPTIYKRRKTALQLFSQTFALREKQILWKSIKKNKCHLLEMKASKRWLSNSSYTLAKSLLTGFQSWLFTGEFGSVSYNVFLCTSMCLFHPSTTRR